MNKRRLLLVLLVFAALAVNAQKQITVLANKPVAKVSRTRDEATVVLQSTSANNAEYQYTIYNL